MSLFDLSNALPQLTTQASVPWSETYQLPPGIPTPIAPARPVTTPTTDSPSITDLFAAALNNMGIGSPGLSAADSATSYTGHNSTSPGVSSQSPAIVADVVAVLVGLVLIAGAVLSFSTIRDTVVTTAKGAAALAA